MKANQTAPKNIDEYIAGFPEQVREILEEIRRTIRQAAPDAEEAIKYGMPTFTLKGNLVSFAAYKKHIGLYPAPTGSEEFNQELAPYRAAISSVRFPFDKPIPFPLITQIVELRVKEGLRRADSRGKR